MDDSNKSIKCEVESCKYNNKADSYCTLNEIKVSSTCDNCNARKKKQSVIVLKKKIANQSYFLSYLSMFSHIKASVYFLDKS